MNAAWMRNVHPAMRWFALLLPFLFALAASGCSPREYLHADTAAGAGVRVAPTAVWVKGEKLFVRLLVMNDSPSAIVFRRDATSARPLRESSGALVANTSVGQAMPANAYQATFEAPFVAVEPGGARAVNIEFRDQGFDWAERERGRDRLRWIDRGPRQRRPLERARRPSQTR